MAELDTVTVTFVVNTKPFMEAVAAIRKVMQDAIPVINALFEAYMRTLPWYKRWPIRARIWANHQRWLLRRWYDRQVWYPLW